MNDPLAHTILLQVYEEVHNLLLLAVDGQRVRTISLVFGGSDYWENAKKDFLELFRKDFLELYTNRYDVDDQDYIWLHNSFAGVSFWNMDRLRELLSRKGLLIGPDGSLPVYERDFIYLIDLDADQKAEIDSHRDRPYFTKMAQWKVVDLK